MKKITLIQVLIAAANLLFGIISFWAK